MDFINNAFTGFKADPLGYCIGLCINIFFAALGIWAVISISHWAVNLITSAI
jgi:hypothetical protein